LHSTSPTSMAFFFPPCMYLHPCCCGVRTGKNNMDWNETIRTICIVLVIGFLLWLLMQTIQTTTTKNENGDDQEQWCRQYRPIYNPTIWSAPEVIEFNNCYSYAFRNLALNAATKPQPGERSGLAPANFYTCANIFERVQADNPGVLRWKSNQDPCP